MDIRAFFSQDRTYRPPDVVVSVPAINDGSSAERLEVIAIRRKWGIADDFFSTRSGGGRTRNQLWLRLLVNWSTMFVSEGGRVVDLPDACPSVPAVFAQHRYRETEKHTCCGSRRVSKYSFAVFCLRHCLTPRVRYVCAAATEKEKERERGREREREREEKKWSFESKVDWVVLTFIGFP